jgi:hypothetical protein
MRTAGLLVSAERANNAGLRIMCTLVNILAEALLHSFKVLQEVGIHAQILSYVAPGLLKIDTAIAAP